MSKPKNETKTEALAMREGFNPDEAIDVEISRTWLQPEPGVVHMLPLRRSDDVREMFKDKDGKVSPKPKYLWQCELLGPAILYKDKEPIQGKAGDVFLMFEPAHPGIRDYFKQAAARGHAVSLINEGKKPRFVKSIGITTDVWSYKCKGVPRRFEPLSNVAMLTMPSAEDVKALPESIRTADQTGD